MNTAYRGRFAPSPTGLLHAGSLVAALASWLDARAHGGVWLVRMEDVDTPRCVPGAAQAILAQLAACGMQSDEPVLRQSQRHSAYAAALAQLQADGWVYPCNCSRQDLGAALAYPGHCRTGLSRSRAERAWRMRVSGFSASQIDFLMANQPGVAGFWAFDATNSVVSWHDHRLGKQRQNLDAELGDFVLKRADGLWAYQLAVVVDDAFQGVTHVVRGEDLADNTPRQLLLHAALGSAAPEHLHTPLVRATDGQKLSKQTGAQPPLLASQADASAALNAAAAVLGLGAVDAAPAQQLLAWVHPWAERRSPLG